MRPALRLVSFAYARGDPPSADLVCDMRFLRNPHWQDGLRERDGRDAEVGAYIAGDPAYAGAVAGIEAALLSLLEPGRDPVSAAFGCTGGRHRSVHVAEHVAARLRAAGFSITVAHRDLATPPRDGRSPGAGRTAVQGE